MRVRRGLQACQLQTHSRLLWRPAGLEEEGREGLSPLVNEMSEEAQLK